MANKPALVQRQLISFRLPEPLLEQAKAASYWDRVKMTEVVERALAQWVQQAQRRHNEGRPFAPVEK